MIVFDTTTLSLLFLPGVTIGSRLTNKPVKYAKERVDALIDRIATDEDAILIPAPVLSELVVKIPSRADELLGKTRKTECGAIRSRLGLAVRAAPFARLKKLRATPWFRIGSFDAAAAVELGLRTTKAMAAGDKREGLQADWTKVKFDRQIVAIALVNNAAEIISDDAAVASIGERWGVKVTSIEDLPLPPELIPPPLLAPLED